MNYSITQGTNLATLAGLIVMIAAHYHVVVGNDEVITVLAGLVSIGGVVSNWIHRHAAGDLTVAGFRK